MSDSREQFEAWRTSQQTRPIDHTEWAFEIWQAGQAQAASRCAELASHQQDIADCVEAIRAEFPKAFK